MISKIEFVQKNKKKIWVVEHNLDEHGANIEDAFINYSARTSFINTILFCQYVKSKSSFFNCKVISRT